jgi:hypothetical protein
MYYCVTIKQIRIIIIISHIHAEDKIIPYPFIHSFIHIFLLKEDLQLSS